MITGWWLVGVEQAHLLVCCYDQGNLKWLDGTGWKLRSLLKVFTRSCDTCGLGAISLIFLQIPLFRKAKKTQIMGESIRIIFELKNQNVKFKGSL